MADGFIAFIHTDKFNPDTMKPLKLFVPAFFLSLVVSSCGNSNVETVKADSTVTSASAGNVQLPDPISTDTTSAAPRAINDTTDLKQPDSQKVAFPAAADKK